MVANIYTKYILPMLDTLTFSITELLKLEPYYSYGYTVPESQEPPSYKPPSSLQTVRHCCVTTTPQKHNSHIFFILTY